MLIDVFSMCLDRESASHGSVFLFLFLFRTVFSHGFWSVNRSYALCMGSTTSLTSQISGGQCTLVGPVHYLRNPQISFFNNFFINFFITNRSHMHETHKSLFSATFSLQMSHTVLFTHLKIILLQCF